MDIASSDLVHTHHYWPWTVQAPAEEPRTLCDHTSPVDDLHSFKLAQHRQECALLRRYACGWPGYGGNSGMSNAVHSAAAHLQLCRSCLYSYIIRGNICFHIHSSSPNMNRRRDCFAGFALALLLVLLAPAACYGRVMAVDIGAEFLKVSVVAPGRQPISIAINEMSRRKTPVLAGFVDGQRVLGEDAVTLSARHPDKFVRRLRDLIGRPADDPTVQAVLEQSALNYDVVPDERRGSLRVRLPGFERPFTIEELVVCAPLHTDGRQR